MVHKILKCPKCNSYTLKEEHCNTKTITVKPAKYSPEDKWSHYRRLGRKNVMEN